MVLRWTGGGACTKTILFLLFQNLIWKYYEFKFVLALKQLSCKDVIYGKKYLPHI
uniref:AsIV-cont00039-ORF2 n=1 Tax=Apophua simplicipes ichnovirus TaxID=1329648 RepID=S5DSZ5_9VIRU|nr:AsIV-cont00039-ORF2 [Apophua simplicipes ichnovirus]